MSDNKDKGRIKRRNMIAKRMLVEQRDQYRERRVKDATKKKPKKINVRDIERYLDV